MLQAQLIYTTLHVIYTALHTMQDYKFYQKIKF